MTTRVRIAAGRLAACQPATHSESMQINTSSHSILQPLGTLVVFLATSLSSALGYPQKTPITSADQLPRRTVQLEDSVTEILGDRARLDALARELLANLQADLERFEIKDPSTLSNYHATIGILHAEVEGFGTARDSRRLCHEPLLRRPSRGSADQG